MRKPSVDGQFRREYQRWPGIVPGHLLCGRKERHWIGTNMLLQDFDEVSRVAEAWRQPGRLVIAEASRSLRRENQDEDIAR